MRFAPPAAHPGRSRSRLGCAALGVGHLGHSRLRQPPADDRPVTAIDDRRQVTPAVSTSASLTTAGLLVPFRSSFGTRALIPCPALETDHLSRAQAIADGVLVDVTEWASTRQMMGGFTIPGRAHDGRL